MLDFGIVEIPLQAVNVIVIVTALLLAANYIGYSILAVISGLIAVVYGLRGGFMGGELVIFDYQFSVTEAWLLTIIGGFAVYLGARSFLAQDRAATWN